MLHKLCIFLFSTETASILCTSFLFQKLYEVKNENKKTLTKVALTTGLALTAVAPYGVGHAEETDQLQVQIQEESFRSGELTQPSQKAPENVVKDALKEKTEQALSPKQVNGETGVDYKVLQKRGSYDGTTLVRIQQTYKGKEVWPSINCTRR